MNFGLCTLSNKEKSVEDVARIAADVGYDGLEIWGNGHVGDGSVETCREISAASEGAGIDIPAYGSYLRAGADEFEDTVAHEVAVADRLGADCVRVWAGHSGYDDHDPTHFDQVVDDLRAVSEGAAERDLAVTVEKHANTLTDTLSGARAVIEAVDRTNCGLNYQPGFSVPADVIANEVDTLGPLVNHCHLQAVRECGSSDRCPLSEAFYDVEGVLDGLEATGFDGYAMIEFVTDERPYREAIADDLAHLRLLV